MTKNNLNEILQSMSIGEKKELLRKMLAEKNTHIDDASLEDFRENHGRKHHEIDRFNSWVNHYKNEGLYSIETIRTGATGPVVNIRRQTGEEYKVINFANYNYLGYATHPQVIKAAHEALDKFGLGATASPLVSGMLDVHKELEDVVTEYFGQSGYGVTLFTSGFGALVGAISAYIHQHDHVVIDSLSHASIVDGVAASGGKLHMFDHNNMEELESILKHIDDGNTRILICAEGVYSADGDYGDIKNIVRLAKKYGAKTLVDEAHSMLIAGENGRGACEEEGVLADVDMIVGTFSKSFSGVGGFLYAKKELTNYVNFYARNRMFSCALDPAVTGGMVAATKIAMTAEGKERRQRLIDNADYFRSLLREHVDISDSSTWIVPAIFGKDSQMFPIATYLQQNGLEGSMMCYPSVPKNQGRIRSFLSSEHSREDLKKGAEIILMAAEKFNFIMK